MFPPFIGITSYRVRSHVVPRIALLYFVMLLFALLFIVFTLRYFFPVDPETAADPPVIDYIDDDPSFLPEQPGKPPPPPLDHQISPILFSVTLALELLLLMIR